MNLKNTLKSLLMLSLIIPAATGCKEEIDQTLTDETTRFSEVCETTGGKAIYTQSDGTPYDFARLQQLLQAALAKLKPDGQTAIEDKLSRVDSLCSCNNTPCGLGAVCKLDMAHGLSCTETFTDLSLVQCEAGETCKEVYYFEIDLQDLIKLVNNNSDSDKSENSETAENNNILSNLKSLMANEKDKSLIKADAKLYVYKRGTVRLYLQDMEFGILLDRLAKFNTQIIDLDGETTDLSALILSNLKSSPAEITCDHGLVKLNRLCDRCTSDGKCHAMKSECSTYTVTSSQMTESVDALINALEGSNFNFNSAMSKLEEGLTKAPPVCINGQATQGYLVECKDNKLPTPEELDNTIGQTNNNNYLLCLNGCNDNASNCYRQMECELTDKDKIKCMSGYVSGELGSVIVKCTRNTASRTGFSWVFSDTNLICGTNKNSGRNCIEEYLLPHEDDIKLNDENGIIDNPLINICQNKMTVPKYDKK